VRIPDPPNAVDVGSEDLRLHAVATAWASGGGHAGCGGCAATGTPGGSRSRVYLNGPRRAAIASRATPEVFSGTSEDERLQRDGLIDVEEHDHAEPHGGGPREGSNPRRPSGPGHTKGDDTEADRHDEAQDHKVEEHTRTVAAPTLRRRAYLSLRVRSGSKRRAARHRARS
jgi:hypothetical protein